MRPARPARPRGQNWKTFLHTHAEQVWACDFLPVTDLFFRSLFAFFIIELHSRKVIHVGVTRYPTDAWTAEPLREATAYGVGPKCLIRDNEGTFGVGFARLANTSTIEILTTPYYAPRANAICERFLGSVRRECLDHLLILHEKQLHRVLGASVHSFNRARPHQGITQQIPEPQAGPMPPDPAGGKVLSCAILGGSIMTIEEVHTYLRISEDVTARGMRRVVLATWDIRSKKLRQRWLYRFLFLSICLAGRP